MNIISVIRNIKNKLLVPVVLVAVVIGVVMLLNSDLEHIEDTNGADNFELQTITDENIINKDIGSLGPEITTGIVTNMLEIHSEKFTGVYEVLYVNLVGESDFLLNIYDLKLNSGNFKMVIIHDGKIVKTLTQENYEETLFEDIKGTVSLVIAGESADFSFKMTQLDYDNFSHS